jgi:hypothetical protein
VDSNTERLADLASQTRIHYTQAREWHDEETDKLNEVMDDIAIWKEKNQSKEKGMYSYWVYFLLHF